MGNGYDPDLIQQILEPDPNYLFSDLQISTVCLSLVISSGQLFFLSSGAGSLSLNFLKARLEKLFIYSMSKCCWAKIPVL